MDASVLWMVSYLQAANLNITNMLIFLRQEDVSSQPNPQAGLPPFVSCPRQLIDVTATLHIWWPFCPPATWEQRAMPWQQTDPRFF
jgi:hypothetical protein